jgi:cbb3-type cytochrome oxidase subunit 3
MQKNDVLGRVLVTVMATLFAMYIGVIFVYGPNWKASADAAKRAELIESCENLMAEPWHLSGKGNLVQHVQSLVERLQRSARYDEVFNRLNLNYDALDVWLQGVDVCDAEHLSASEVILTHLTPDCYFSEAP